MKSASSTPSSARKPGRNHLGEYLPLYKKFSDNNTELNTSSKTSENQEISATKIWSESPKRQRPSSKHGKRPLDISQIIIDGSNLNSTDGAYCTPLESRVASPTLATKRSTKGNETLKKYASTIENSLTTDDDVRDISKSQKRSKSVSFLLDEKEQAVTKKAKADDPHYGAGDTPQKIKKLKTKKSEKENEVEDEHVTQEIKSPKKKKLKNKGKSESDDVQFAPDDVTEQGDTVVSNKQNRQGKLTKGKKKEKLDHVPEKTRRAKKQKHQHMDENDEPASKSPRKEVIDDLENLNLGDSPDTITDLIDEMAVVDKTKKKKKLANREKKQKGSEKHQNGEQKQPQNEDGNEEAEPKKWEVKRWNKRQLANRDQSITLNVDNIPASLLKGSYKKVVIDHFGKYGLFRNAGEPIIQNEKDPNPVFSIKIFFNTAEAAAQALELDGSKLAGNQIRVSAMRPMSETVLVVRLYDQPSKLTNEDITSAFGHLGIIRSIRPMLRKKKTMATTFVEFDSPEAVESALEKCASLTIHGKKVMGSRYITTGNEHRKRASGQSRKKPKNKVNVVSDNK